MRKTDHAAAQRQQSQVPVFLCAMEGRNYWQYMDRVYSDSDGLTIQEIHALLRARQQQEQRKVDRALAMMERQGSAELTRREFITDEVKQFVFQRDDGRCRNCGAASELQFDHIIPVALGGSSESENLQILCGPCNRLKGAGLTTRGIPS